MRACPESLPPTRFTSALYYYTLEAPCCSRVLHAWIERKRLKHPSSQQERSKHDAPPYGNAVQNVGRTLPRPTVKRVVLAHCSRALPEGGKASFASDVAVGWQGSAAESMVVR